MLVQLLLKINNKLSDSRFVNVRRPPGGIIADTRTGSTGNGGKITLETGKLSLKDGAIVTTDTKGSGDAGNTLIRATDLVEVAGKLSPCVNFNTQIVTAVRRYATGKGGELGYLYEENKQFSEALQLTNQAVAIAQNLQATEAIPMLRWQQGRILKAQGKKDSAIAAYSQAVKGIETLRQDLVAVNSENSDMQFSFRKRVEPVYRQLVELLVQDLDKLPQEIKQQYLEKSRLTIEGLQQRELENFFRAACLTARKQNIDNIDTQAAVIYPIILNQSLEIIVSLPGQPLKHYSTKLSSEERVQIFQEVRQYLNPVFKSTDILPSA